MFSQLDKHDPYIMFINKDRGGTSCRSETAKQPVARA
jgi:hypothetical protein